MHLSRGMLKILGILIIVGHFTISNSQTVYHHISNKEIYFFLDEMANLGLIEINSAIKPYSRMFIASKLDEVQEHTGKLNKRQLEELNFYLRDFNKELLPGKNYKKRLDLFYYKDSLFTFSINPILGVQYWTNQNGNNYHTWNGAEVFAYVGKYLGVYANLRDNHEEKRLSSAEYLDKRPAARYKSGTDYSEMRGGMTLSWNWGTFGLVKDHIEWGNNYHYPSIISGKAPSFTQLKLNLKPAEWLDFNYFHGWLNSGIIDSTRSYSYINNYRTSTRIVYRKKYIAANMFTFKPLKGLFASVGNSIVYSDVDVNPVYLIPFMLYKSIDHTLNHNLSNDGGQNSQFFIDVSSRQINHVHLYASLFFDDISISRLKQNGHLDYYSLNTGFKVSNLIPNLSFCFEYFQSYPLVYKHDMPTTSYESNFYNLGHFMQDNSRSYYADIVYRPLKGFYIKFYYNRAEHGPDHESLGTDRQEVVNLFLDSVEWETSKFGLSLSYQLFNDLYFFGELTYNTVKGDIDKYSTPYFHGELYTISFGANIGF